MMRLFPVCLRKTRRMVGQREIAAALALIIAVWSTVTLAQHAAQTKDVRAGQELAETICANCHSVAPNEPATHVLSPQPPSFSAIADDPSATPKTLRRFISTTHWDEQTFPMTMPDPMLLDEEYDEVAAYILSLRSPEAAAAAAARARLAVSPTSPRVETGEELALRQCSLCHVVSADPRYRPSLRQATPSFEAIANQPGTTAKSLRKFITTTHWDDKTIPMTMPDQALLGSEPEDVVAYILSLRKRH